jgi:hypothetical protein
VGYCEHGKEPLISIKGRALVEQLSHYQLHKKDSAPLNYTVVFAMHNPYNGCLLQVPHCCQSLSQKLLRTYLITVSDDEERETVTVAWEKDATMA